MGFGFAPLGVGALRISWTQALFSVIDEEETPLRTILEPDNAMRTRSHRERGEHPGQPVEIWVEWALLADDLVERVDHVPP